MTETDNNGGSQRSTISVPKKIAEEVRQILLENDLFDPERSIGRNDRIHFPVLVTRPDDLVIMDRIMRLSEWIEISQDPGMTHLRQPRPSPYEIIRKAVNSIIGPDLIDLLPSRWDMIGDCLVLKLPSQLLPEKERIARTYEDVLGARYSLLDSSGIEGELREPTFEVLTEPNDGRWETVHLENSIKYSLDPRRIMFSSGNVDERMGMIDVINGGPSPPGIEKERDREVVIDMFAGIGYFSLSIASGCDVDRVYAIEKNPNSYYYLERNIRLNGMLDRVIPIFGDNRRVGPDKKADRIIMGYVGGTVDFIPRAVDLSSTRGSIIHLHDTVRMEDGPDGLFKKVLNGIEGSGLTAELFSWRKVKSYAPRIDHIVLDIGLSPI